MPSFDQRSRPAAIQPADRRPVAGPHSGAAALAILAGLATGCGGGPESGPRGVLLISIDSLRADHLSSYGYRSSTAPAEATTPNIDRLLADQGTRFEQVVSTTSWTLPSHLALLTGQPDEVHGVRDLPDRLSPEHQLLAEAFADEGWRTFGIWSGPNLHPWFGFGRGFETYDDCSSVAVADADGMFGVDGVAPGSEAWGDVRSLHERSHHGVTGPAVVGAFERRLAEIGDDERYFAFVHMWDVHYDYNAPRAFDIFFPGAERYDGPIDGQDFKDYGRRFLVDKEPLDDRDLARLISLYDAEIRYTDDNIGRMLAALEARGRLDDSLVVVTSDHGEEFLDHQNFGHKNGLYDEVLRVPLLLRLPGTIPAGRTIAPLVGLVDVAPTIADYARLVDFGSGVFGHSLRPAIEGGAQVERPLPLELTVRPLSLDVRGVRGPGWKVLRPGPGLKPGLFDLGRDPSERRFLVPPQAEREADPRFARAETLWSELDALAALRAGASPGELPSALREQLIAAGYLVDDGDGGPDEGGEQ
ncbi:sulfatase [Engelhardtia mirabilis]|uniref:Choline-sulfatase n=1 Tax=Engelhardtia mirabilis TaxID=2528011 RepID=A0A518BJ09_9BACT|nr:Choline-sulfatase [Planctomycetes bacterium Pla133]QDV01297.1 Choline-sulfatase [Planctomycetes bacterium Pla86]